MRKLEYEIPAEYDGRPLLHFLRGGAKLSVHIVAMLRHTENAVFVNGVFSRVIDRVKAGDRVTVLLPEKTTPPAPCDIPLDVLYEDEDLLAINKPAGLAVHPTHNHQEGTLANAVSAYLQNGAAARAVGRLDKGTSGVMLFAKNVLAASRLNGALRKTYIALAEGALTGSGTIEAPIIRPDPGKTLRAVGEGGEPAVTDWRALETSGGATLLEVTTRTGRTHQIRVHLASCGHPLVGDDMYGGTRTETMARPALHCARIRFTHPVTGAAIEVSAPLPADFTAELAARRARAAEPEKT